MKVYRMGNMDMHLVISNEELSKLESLTKEGVVFTSKLKSHSQDPTNGAEVQLVYEPDLYVDGLDGRDVASHFKNPPMPIYIGKRGIKRLSEGDYPCGGAVLSTKIEISVQKPRNH